MAVASGLTSVILTLTPFVLAVAPGTGVCYKGGDVRYKGVRGIMITKGVARAVRSGPS